MAQPGNAKEDEEFAQFLAGSKRGYLLRFQAGLDQIEAAIRRSFWGRLFLWLWRWR